MLAPAAVPAPRVLVAVVAVAGAAVVGVAADVVAAAGVAALDVAAAGCVEEAGAAPKSPPAGFV